MTPDPKSGLVAVIDRGATKNEPKSINMFPVDAKEAFLRGGTLKDDKPRYVLADSYVEPDPA